MAKKGKTWHFTPRKKGLKNTDISLTKIEIIEDCYHEYLVI